MTICLTILALALLCFGSILVGAVVGLFIGCCCALSGDISRDEELYADFSDPWWPS